MLVRIINPYTDTKEGIIFRQTPGNSKKWGNIEFTLEPVQECDLIVVINYCPQNIKVKCREAWLIHQEPPNEDYFGHWKKQYPAYDKVITNFKDIENGILDHGAIFWFLYEGYDYYSSLEPGAKDEEISCITSSKKKFPGHKLRLKFIEELQKNVSVDIYGNGFRYVEKKSDVLLKSKYTLSIENTSCRSYFSEKICDAFLCWNMPIYYGAPDITNYFPKESMIIIDINRPQESIKIIQEAIKNNLWEKNFEYIKEARDLVLNKYNFFSYINEKIETCELINKPKNIKILPSALKDNPSLIFRLRRFLNL